MMPDLNQLIMPFILFLLWVQILFQLRAGWKSGVMTWSKKGGSEFSDDDTTRTTERSKNRWDFWSLFIFYCIVASVLPLIIGYALLNYERVV